ncbi:hypothetical protein BLA29_014030 [Euroglyphus maynei]|uniref:Uncharacterized protein n=1 Tax=Euroglyphus maynei TaxID=6958 RepID=A0A1Y3BL76_EURMA|nr:hypothetical protein BLA29_014030 [Euroglyphus maynei]
MQKIKIYHDNLDDYNVEISAKRPRKYAGVEIVEQELQTLNTDYKNLLDKVLSYLNQLQDDESRIREFVSIIHNNLYFKKKTKTNK